MIDPEAGGDLGAERIAVVVPAHDEETTIGACLAGLLGAAEQALDRTAVRQVHLVLVADRCTDRTVEEARAAVSRSSVRSTEGVTTEIISHDQAGTVGGVRNAGVRAATRVLGADDRTWLFSTDADSVVPPGWISDGLRLARGSVMLLGLVDLVDSAAELERRHQALVAGGVRTDGSHDHAYAANLMIRADVLASVGGFPEVRHGEERALADRVAAAGWPVRSHSGWRVDTSARTTGRAPTGLHAVLRQLLSGEDEFSNRRDWDGSERVDDVRDAPSRPL